MKILIVHNSYGKFSGEEAVVADHIAMLKQRGISVIEFRRSSAELQGVYGSAKAFICGIWNPVSALHFGDFLDIQKPNVVHIHNLFPLISPSILKECRKRRIPVVMTLHNFRLFCPNGLFFRTTGLCEECAQQQSVVPCIHHNCERSFFKTLGYAFRTLAAKWRQDFTKNIDRYLCLTDFQMAKMISYGIPGEKCILLPNCISEKWLLQAQNASSGQGKYVAYTGRFSHEKGIEQILDAARRMRHIPFLLAGHGAEKYINDKPDNVEFVGYLRDEALFEFIRNAKMQVMASRCYENFPVSLLQAMSLGIPCVVPALGGMPDIVGDGGVTFKPGCHEELAEVIGRLWRNDSEWHILSDAARRRCREMYSTDAIATALISIYKELI